MMADVITMSVQQFEALVADALDGIPDELGRAMENVAVVVDDVSPSGRLLGLYEGVPPHPTGEPLLGVHSGPHHDLHGDDLCGLPRHPGSHRAGAQDGDP